MKLLRSFCIGWFVVLLAAVVLLGGLTSAVHATDYFFQTGGSLNVAGSWNTARDGSGAPAADFTTAGNTFVIQNAQAPSLTNSTAWSISGAGSGLLIETGGTMSSGTNNPTLPLSMQSGANYIVTSGATAWGNLNFVAVDAASTFTVTGNAAKTLADKPYGNLTWTNSANQSPVGNLNVAGTLTAFSGAQLRVGTGAVGQTWNIGGDLVINSSGPGNATTLILNQGPNTCAINLLGSLFNNVNSVISKPTNGAGTGNTTFTFDGSAPSTANWGTVNTANNFNTVFFQVGTPTNSTKVLTFNDSLNEGPATFTVYGTLNFGLPANTLSGASGKFVLNSGGTLITANATGLDGSITLTDPNKTFSSAANYEFRGAATGATLPATVRDLTINRASGDVDLQGAGATQTVSNSLKVMSGNLNANGSRQIEVGGNGDAIVMSGGSQINSNATVKMTGTGGVKFDTTNAGTATIAGTVDLNGATRDFNVGDGAADVDMDVSGQLTNGTIAKSGTGTLRISAGQSFTSAATIDINAGKLRADNPTGSATGAANLVLHTGGTLAGSGTVAGSVTVNSGGHLAPGNSIESLNVGTTGAVLSFNAGSNFDYEIKSNNSLATAADLVNLTGDLTISSTAAINFSDLAGLSAVLLPLNTKLTLIAYSGTWDTGTFASQPNGSDVQIGPNAFVLTYDDMTKGINFASEVADNLHYVTLTAVPEAPAFLCIGLVGLLVGGGAFARRKLANRASR